MNIQPVIEALRRSKKYRNLCDDTLLRIAGWATARGGAEKQAIKRAKQKLHQIYAAYLDDWDEPRAAGLLDHLQRHTTAAHIRQACLHILAGHTSTRERIPLLEDFYSRIYAITGTPDSIIDIGCGLHPFALPWLAPHGSVKYIAWEIDKRIVALIQRFFDVTGVEAAAQCGDILVGGPAGQADLAFLLKLLPCLEQQRPKCSADVIRQIPSRLRL